MVATVLFCSYFLKDSIVIMANLSTTQPLAVEGEKAVLEAKNAALKEMVLYEKQMAQKNLNNMDLVLVQNSDVSSMHYNRAERRIYFLILNFRK